MMEVWKWIPGYKRQDKISSHGRVKSVARMRRTKGYGLCPVPARILNPTTTRDGYLVVSLGKQFLVHRLVLCTFVGPCPKGMECRHLDGNPSNNRLNNLKWGTPKQNGQDAVRHGTRPRGEDHHKAKLTWRKVRKMKRLYNTEVCHNQSRLAKRFGISQATTWAIVHYRIWKTTTTHRSTRR